MIYTFIIFLQFLINSEQILYTVP